MQQRAPDRSAARRRFPVAWKGNLMVAIPLIFMLGFAAVLTREINQVERSREQLCNERDLLTLGTRIGYLYERTFACVYFISFLQVQDPIAMKRLTRRYSLLADTMADCAHRLKQGVSTTSSLRLSDAEELEKFVLQLRGLMDEAIYKVPKEQRFGYLTVHGKEFLGFVGKLDAVIGPLRKADLDSPAIMARLYRKLLGTMQAGILASIVLALGLGGFFSADISRRLKLLAENVLRFANKQELLPSPGWSTDVPPASFDEIADLDSSFRSAVGELREAEETKQRYFAAVTCDMEAPIERVRMLVQSLLEGKHGKLSTPAITRLTTVQNNLNRITLLVQDLEDVEKLQTGKLPLSMSVFKAEDLLERTKQMLESAAHARRIAIVVETTNLMLYADEKRLGQVLLNFLSNALKFSPEGSSVILRAYGDNSQGRFEVCDRGPGIAPEVQAKLFQKFQQVSLSDSRRGKGTGLGLSVSKMIIESHRGQIGVKSEPGKGSTFWFMVPADKQSQSD